MKKAFLIVGLLLMVLIGFAAWFYQNIQRDFYAGHDDAIEVALSSSSLMRADHVEYYAGDEPVRIVFGVNEQHEKLIVWVGPEAVYEEKAADGADREQIRSLVAERHGEVEWIRLIPGIYKGAYVWEAFFTIAEQGGERYCYDYYLFRDGAHVDTLWLNAK